MYMRIYMYIFLKKNERKKERKRERERERERHRLNTLSYLPVISSLRMGLAGLQAFECVLAKALLLF